MKKKLSSGLLIMVLFSLLFSAGCQNQKNEEMRHIVIFKYKSSATEQQIAEVNKRFAELKNEIPGIISFEHGINDSPENKNLGFSHVYSMTFENAEARDNYLPHPKHQEFGKFLGELDILEDAFVVDYVPKEQ